MRINIFGGPGAGKTTQALEIAYYLRTRGVEIEYVDEYVKEWAYDGRIPSPLDQIYISGQQFYKEVRVLSHGIPHIITDSPMLLAGLYARYYGGDEEVGELIDAKADFLDKRFPFLNIYIERDEALFNESARLQNLEESKSIDTMILNLLVSRYGEDGFIRINPQDTQGKKALCEKITILLSSK